MPQNIAVIGTLAVYSVLLLAVGIWSVRRTHDRDDYYLGGRRLGAWLAALSASASSSSAWTLLGVSGAAYVWGLKAIWLFPATVGGFLINWLWVARRLRRLAQENRALTLTEVLIADQPGVWAQRIARSAAVIILISFLFYIAAQLEAAGLAFHSSFGLAKEMAITLGAVVVLIYTLLGGFWAVSITDTIQGLLMAAVAVFLPALAVSAVGGWGQLSTGLAETLPVGSWFTGELGGAMAVFFVVGTLGIGIGYPGQPHVVNRFMALRSGTALRQARLVAIVWAVVVYAGMLLLGWSARVLFDGSLAAGEQVMFEFVFQMLPPLMAGIVVAAVLSAVMSTADSQLLVAASALSHDWQLPRGGSPQLFGPRAVVLVLTILALVLALLLPASIFTRVLFAWHAIGAAFGPPLILRLVGRQLRPVPMLVAVNLGFAMTVVLHWFPDTPGDALERLLPFMLSFLVAASGSYARMESPAGGVANIE